ncbi:hypothetical protein KJ693_05670 [bacterium]|nr:hypothetical protein [bacterium]MBU1614787.1 hypothetical protein [bacterium]
MREDRDRAGKDTRPIAVRSQTVLEGAEKEIYEYCDRVRNFCSIFHYLKMCHPQDSIDEENLRNFLKYLIDSRLMLEDGDHYLSLAIPSSSAFL